MDVKEVNFRLYCPKCKYYPLGSTDDPCNECLGQPWNENSHKPINYKEKDRNGKKEQRKESKA